MGAPAAALQLLALAPRAGWLPSLKPFLRLLQISVHLRLLETARTRNKKPAVMHALVHTTQSGAPLKHEADSACHYYAITEILKFHNTRHTSAV
jgi:hypothetical protein